MVGGHPDGIRDILDGHCTVHALVAASDPEGKREAVWDAQAGSKGTKMSPEARTNPLLALLWATWSDGARLIYARGLFRSGDFEAAAGKLVAGKKRNRHR